MLLTGPLGVAGAGAAAGGGGALPARAADCIGFADGCVGGFGAAVAGATSGVAGADGADVLWAVRRGLPNGIAVSAGTEAAAAGWAWSCVDGCGVETAAARRTLGGCSVNRRRPEGEGPAALSCRIRPGKVGAGPRESRTLSFTMTSGPLGPPITMVCAAADDAASSAPITLAARQAASRREADVENLPMTNPDFPDGRSYPLTQTSGQNTPPATTPLLRDFA